MLLHGISYWKVSLIRVLGYGSMNPLLNGKGDTDAEEMDVRIAIGSSEKCVGGERRNIGEGEASP